MDHRIHIFGASGSGTTTVGRLLAEHLGVSHLDADDYFWTRSEIPYSNKREREERIALLASDLNRFSSWVLSGSLCGWGDFAIPLFTLVVFLWIPGEIRVGRLRQREIEMFGPEALAPGGWFHENHEAFVAWASAYDSGSLDMRSRVLHEQWMSRLPCKLIRFKQAWPAEELATMIENELNLEQPL